MIDDCKKCPCKKLCKEIGIKDLSCEDIAKIAEDNKGVDDE